MAENEYRFGAEFARGIEDLKGKVWKREKFNARFPRRAHGEIHGSETKIPLSDGDRSGHLHKNWTLRANRKHFSGREREKLKSNGPAIL